MAYNSVVVQKGMR